MDFGNAGSEHLMKSLLIHRGIFPKIGDASVTNRGIHCGKYSLPFYGLSQSTLQTGCNAVTYVADIGLTVTGKYLQGLSYLLQYGFHAVSNWRSESDLDVNPSKTELVLFTRRYKSASFRPPTIFLPRLNT